MRHACRSKKSTMSRRKPRNLQRKNMFTINVRGAAMVALSQSANEGNTCTRMVNATIGHGATTAFVALKRATYHFYCSVPDVGTRHVRQTHLTGWRCDRYSVATTE